MKNKETEIKKQIKKNILSAFKICYGSSIGCKIISFIADPKGWYSEIMETKTTNDGQKYFYHRFESPTDSRTELESLEKLSKVLNLELQLKFKKNIEKKILLDKENIKIKDIQQKIKSLSKKNI